MHVVPPWQSLRQLWMLQKDIIASTRPDLIHANFIDPFATITQWLNIPTVLTPWGSDVYAPFPERFKGAKRLFKWQLLKRTYRRAQIVTALNEHMREQLCTRFGVLSEHILPFSLGVPSTVAVSTEQCRQLRESWGATPETLVLFSPRACRPLYNIAAVVSGFVQAFGREENVQLWVSTFGAEEKYLETIKTLASSGGGRVRFIPPVSHDELSSLISAADVAISVPDSDGLPVTVMQSLAQSRPLLFKSLPQLVGLLKDGEHGIAVENAVEPQIAMAMRGFYRMRLDLEKMQRQCLAQFEQLPTEQQELDKLVATFARMVVRSCR